LLDAALEIWVERILVAVDVRGRRVSVAGWTEGTELRAQGVIERMQGRGVSSFVYTSVERDGTLEGPDLEEVSRVAALVRGELIYSGGIGSLEHLKALRALELPNLAGIVVGKSLYEGSFGVEEAQRALQEPP
jgi:phosphoribosylformimino-5-aminoimidazole carboxamide ribotide isomerase